MLSVLYLLILIVVTVVIVKIKVAKVNSDFGGLQEYMGIPQPVILNDNRTKIAQIKLSYYITDKKKFYRAKKYGMDFARIIEVGGMAFLRTALGDKEGKSFEEGFPEIEINTQNYLTEEAKELGLELTEVVIKVGEKEEF